MFYKRSGCHSQPSNAKKVALTAVSGMVLAATVGAAHAQTPRENVGVEEIIVTAERREESLQDVPIAITAVGGAELLERGVSQPTDLNRIAPGLGIGQGGPATQVYLRGVGNYATNAFADPAIAFNMDGVYISRFSGLSGNFYDIDRIEVLKGPQGTLYGRNATGGAINIITRRPDLDGFSAGGGVDIGNYNLQRFDGYVNVPISEHAALRIAAQDTSRDGYQSDGYDDDESTGARAHLLWEPSPDSSLLFTANYLELGGRGAVHVPVTNNGFVDPNDQWRGQSETLPGLLLVPPIFGGVDRTTGTLDVVVHSYGAQIEHDFGAVDLNLLVNYMSNDNTSKFFGPGFLVDTRTNSEQSSVEARLSGGGGALEWVVGAYGFDENQSENFWVDQGFLFNQTGIDTELDTTAYALFGQATFSLSEQLRLTGGLRYSVEERAADGLTFGREPGGFTCAANGTTAVTIATVSSYIPQAAVNGAGIPYPFTFCQDVQLGERDWDDLSYRVALDFDITPDSLVYASVSRGFKSGGFFGAGNASITGNVYEPETLLAYAVGSKNRFFDGRVQLNTEAFFWEYSDHQESYLAPTSTAGAFNFVTQRADAEIYGLDVEFNALVTDDDAIGIRMQYLHAEYTDAPFVMASPGPGNPPPRTECTTAQDPVTPAIWYADCSGQQMPRSPELSLVADYQHTFDLGSNGEITAGVHGRYSDDYWSAVDYNPLQQQEAFTTVGATLGYRAPGARWSIVAYGENLTEEVVYTNAFMYPSKNSATAGGANNIAMVQLDTPTTYGIRFRADF